MAKKNLAEAAAAILSGNMASLKPMSQGAEAFGQVGNTPMVATPGQEGSPQTIQPAIASADEAGVSKAAAAAPTATPPGAKPAPAEPMQKAPPQVNEEDEDEKSEKEDSDDMKKETYHMKNEEKDEDEEEEKSEKDEDEKEDDEDDKKAMKEDLDALFHGENLSEDFMNKAATIFEAAVTARVNSLEEKIQEQYA